MGVLVIPEQAERNVDIFERHLKGETFKKMAYDYNISPTRCSQIYDKWHRFFKLIIKIFYTGEIYYTDVDINRRLIEANLMSYNYDDEVNIPNGKLDNLYQLFMKKYN